MQKEKKKIDVSKRGPSNFAHTAIRLDQLRRLSEGRSEYM